MTDKKNDGMGISPIVIGAVGAAVGAAVVALSDKKNRDKVSDAIDQAGARAEEMKGDAEEKFDDVKSQVTEASENAEQALKDLKKSNT